MIEFLRPGALWAIPLAGVPAVLHLWGRVRARPTPFTAVDLLREAAHTHFSTERLRRWLLLLVRTLLILALILFLARPGFRGAMGGGAVRGVLLLDASYSMQASQLGESAFDRARNIARAVVQSGDQWGLVVFSDRVEKSVSPEGDPNRILLALEAARPTFRGTNFSRGFAEAAKHLKGAGPIVFLSDGAAHGVSTGTVVWDKRCTVVAAEMVARRPNAGIMGIHGTPPPWAEILGWGENPVRTWALWQGGRWTARGNVRWETTGRGRAIVPLGKGVSELALRSDSLPPDDRWFFVSGTRTPFSVCLVNGAPSLSPVGDETYFIRPVLDSLSSAGMTVVGASPAHLASFSFSDQSVVVLLNPPPLSSAAGERLTAFVESGGGLWVTAGDRGGASSLKDLLPLVSLSPGDGAEGLEWCGGDILSGLEGLLWNRVQADRFISGDLRPGAQVVVRAVRTKRPLLSVHSRGRGRVAFWGSTLDRDWTNLPAKPAFPVLVGDLLPWLSGPPRGEGEGEGPLFVGDAIFLPGEEGRPLSVHRPDGQIADGMGARSVGV
ncbi:MAG: VWA domain-containing protein [Elusimicrobia bacterium]|nr:VWA domain-containing protein [Elusimicrobiota bacterium]